jgi:hypothetical protein
VAVATATLLCACRDRRSVFRRMVPLTDYEGWGYLDSARGGRSCGGERPGRPPARGRDHELVISAQTKPASSRAIAVTATPAGLLRAVLVLYRAYSRRCACQERASVCWLASCWRRRRVRPIAVLCRQAHPASISAVRTGSEPAQPRDRLGQRGPGRAEPAYRGRAGRGGGQVPTVAELEFPKYLRVSEGYDKRKLLIH